jgi:hypothetical protein
MQLDDQRSFFLARGDGHDFRVGMAQENLDQFDSSVAGAAEDGDSCHERNYSTRLVAPNRACRLCDCFLLGSVKVTGLATICLELGVPSIAATRPS